MHFAHTAFFPELDPSGALAVTFEGIIKMDLKTRLICSIGGASRAVSYKSIARI